MKKEPEAIIQNEILPIIATYYPYSLKDIRALYDRQEMKPSFDWVIEVCEYALWQGFSNLEDAEREMLKPLEDADIEKRALEAAFEQLEQRKRIDEVTDLAMKGLLVDGWFHKQWYLEKILEALRVEFGGNYKRGIAP